MKAARSTTIIGGADGPTSVFLIGKAHGDKNIFRRIRNNFRQQLYRRRRQRIEKKIKPGAHSIAETVQYMIKHYGAKEAGPSYPHFEERRLQMKCVLLQHEKPELLGPRPQFLPPKDIHDQASVQAWMEKIEAWQKEYEKMADQLPQESFPTDFHLYYIDRGEDGTLEIESDAVHQVLTCSWHGKKEKMNPIARDIHLYYGVSEEDIRKKTERYHMLVTELTT